MTFNTKKYLNEVDATFIVFDYNKLFTPLNIFRQLKLINELKKKAPHLLLTTKIEEYKEINLLHTLTISIYNLFVDNKISIKKTNSGKRYLSYNSYKVSVKRLTISLINSNDKSVLKGFSYQKLKQKEDLISLIKKESGNSPYISYFTYPAKELELEKTILYSSDKLSFKIIPWFDWVYFEIDLKNKEISTITDSISKINSLFPDLSIDGNKIVQKGTAYKSDVYQTIVDIFFSKNKKNLNILTGSNFSFPYNPIKIMEYCDEKYDEAKHILNNPHFFKKLFYRYGTEIEEITYQAYEFWNKTKDIKKSWLMAEIWYAINHENCNAAKDYIFNHTENWMSTKADHELIELTFNELKGNN